MSITHNLDNLTDKQKSDIELAKTLSNRIDSLRPKYFNKIQLTYNGKKFYPIKGYFSEFLVNDIHLAIEGDFDKHKSFMIDSISKIFKDYDSSSKSKSSLEQLKMNTNTLLKYYGYKNDLKYPMYSEKIKFKNYLEDLYKAVKKGLLES